jgi:hypothetical protein
MTCLTNAGFASLPRLSARRLSCFRDAVFFSLIILFLAGCSSSSQSHGSLGSNESEGTPDELFQTHTDRVATLGMRTNLDALYRLMGKLYRRNPNEWRKTGAPNVQVAEQRIRLAIEQQQPLRELGGRSDIAALAYILGPDYRGDRVGGFIYALGSMVITAHGGQTNFYMTDVLNAQYIHNAARNMEKASWMLANRKDPQGHPWLLSNEMSVQGQNLSYAIEFGKIVARLDLLTEVLDESGRRMGVSYAQSLLFMNFLPVQ